jgi:hypothetical protein
VKATNTVWKMRKRRLREYNGGDKIVQSILCTSMKFSQWNSLVLLMIPKNKERATLMDSHYYTFKINKTLGYVIVDTYQKYMKPSLLLLPMIHMET